MAENIESQEIETQLNTFYRDNYHRTIKWLIIMTVICAILSAILTWMTFDRKQPAYYAAVTTGQVIPMHALSEPVVTSDFIVEWSALTARLIYNLNFATYQNQLNQVKDRFTADGWEKMNAALNASGMIKELVDSKLIISSVISGPPVIVARMIIDGRYTWRVQMRVLVTYTSPNQTRQRTITVTMNVQRVPTLDTSQGIQIIDFKSTTASE